MALSEIFFLILPIIWFVCERIFIKKSPLSPTRWVLLLVGCLGLSFFLSRKLSAMMGGRWLWPEVLYYGWFLFSLFVLLQICKRLVSSLLGSIIKHPANEKTRKTITTFVYYTIMFFTMVPFFLAMTSIHRVKVGDNFDPQSMLGYEYQDITLRTGDGINIDAWFIPAKSDKVVVIAQDLPTS